MAKRDEKNLTEYQKRGIELGVDYHWVENGMLTVTQKRAKDYAAESSDRMVLPLGLEHPSVLGSIIKVARSLPITPDEVWTVGSSGTLNRGLQFAWPHATIHVVSVGHTMNEREIGRAIYHSPYFLAEIEREVFGNNNIPTRSEVMEKLIPYIQEETSKGVQLNHIMRHTVGLFHGQNGSRTWKQYLSKNMCIRDADLQKVNHIMDQVRKTTPVSLER